MKQNYMQYLKQSTAFVILAMPVFWVGLSQVQASNHRESAFVGNSYDEAGDTDFYAFVGYNKEGSEMVNVVAEFPSMDNGFDAITSVNKGEQTIYTIHLDDNSDGISDYAIAVNLSSVADTAGVENRFGSSTGSSTKNSPTSATSTSTSVVTIPGCLEPGHVAIRKFPHRITFDPETGQFDLVRRGPPQGKTKVSLELPASCVTAGGRILSVWSSSSQLSAGGAIGVSRPDASLSNLQQLNLINKNIGKIGGIEGDSERGTISLSPTQKSLSGSVNEFEIVREIGR